MIQNKLNHYYSPWIRCRDPTIFAGNPETLLKLSVLPSTLQKCRGGWRGGGGGGGERAVSIAGSKATWSITTPPGWDVGPPPFCWYSRETLSYKVCSLSSPDKSAGKMLPTCQHRQMYVMVFKIRSM